MQTEQLINLLTDSAMKTEIAEGVTYSTDNILMELVRNSETVIWLLLPSVLLSLLLTISLLVTLYFVAQLLRVIRADHFNTLFRMEAEEHIIKENYNELIKQAKFTLEEFPHDVYVHWYLAQAYYYSGRWIEARVCFERTLDLEPGWYHAVQSFLERIEEEIRAQVPRLVD